MAADENPELIWERYWLGRPAGTHYSADGSSPLLRDDETNLLVAQPVIGDRDIPSTDTGLGNSDTVKALAVIGGIALLVAAGRGAKKPWDRFQSKREGVAASENSEVNDDASAANDVDEQDALIDEVAALIEVTSGQSERAAASDLSDPPDGDEEDTRTSTTRTTTIRRRSPGSSQSRVS